MGSGSLAPAWHVRQQDWPGHQGLVGTFQGRGACFYAPNDGNTTQQVWLALHVYKCIQEARMPLGPWAPPYCALTNRSQPELARVCLPSDQQRPAWAARLCYLSILALEADSREKNTHCALRVTKHGHV